MLRLVTFLLISCDFRSLHCWTLIWSRRRHTGKLIPHVWFILLSDILLHVIKYIMHVSCRMDYLPLVPILNQMLLGCQHTKNFDYKFPTAHHASLWPPVSQSTTWILPIMPQHAPHQVNTPDNSDSSEYESDFGPGSVGVSSVSQPSALNGRMPQLEDMEVCFIPATMYYDMIS